MRNGKTILSWVAKYQNIRGTGNGWALLVSSMFLYLSNIQNAEAICEGNLVSTTEVTKMIGRSSKALREKNFDQLQQTAKQLEEQLPCIEQLLSPQLFAASYRYIGVGQQLAGSPENAQRWFRLALELDPNYSWGISELSYEDEAYKLYEGEKVVGVSELVAIEGKKLLPPDGKQIYLDGRLWSEAGATLNRPHILFVVSPEDKFIVQRSVIEGNQIPQQYLQTEVVDKKKKEEEEYDPFKVVVIKPVRHPAKNKLLISSAATLAVAGGVYGVTFGTNDQFYAATTTVDKMALRQKNNNLVVTSIVIGTLGLGVGYTGVIIDAGPTLIPWQF